MQENEHKVEIKIQQNSFLEKRMKHVKFCGLVHVAAEVFLHMVFIKGCLVQSHESLQAFTADVHIIPASQTQVLAEYDILCCCEVAIFGQYS